MRPLIARTLDLIEKERAGNPPRIVIEAPTGYGKSISGPLVYREIYRQGYGESFIHVLPLRAIVRDLYLCTLLRSLIKVPTSICGETPLSSSVERSIREAFDEINISVGDIAYQMGELILGEKELEDNIVKEPLFDAKYVVSTLDSFLYNIFRVPITELVIRKKHYAIPRLRIFVSGVYLDEAHTVFEENEEASTVYTAATVAIDTLLSFKVPLVIASATLGKEALNALRRRYGALFKIIRIGKQDREDESLIEVSDREFFDTILSIKWRTELLKSNEATIKALESYQKGLDVLVVRDTVREAIRTYQELTRDCSSENVVLIHGLMTRGDREEALRKIKSTKSPKIVVATSVIEAGVNVSFNVLVTDGLRPRSIVQRAGRLCRYDKCDESFVYIVEEYSNSSLLNIVKDTLNSGREICWRLPHDTEEYKGYEAIIDTAMEPRIDVALEREIRALVEPLFVDYETINMVLRRHNHALVRIGLVEALVGEIDDITKWSYGDAIKNSLVLPAHRIDKLLEKRCVKGLVSLCGDTDVEDLELVCDSRELIEKSFSMANYMRCVARAHVDRCDSKILHTALLITRDCYEKNIGLKAWI